MCTLQADPKCYRAFEYMGVIFEKMGKYGQAAGYFQSAINAIPPQNIVKVLQATASKSNPLFLLGEVEEAIEVLEEGLKKAAANYREKSTGCEMATGLMFEGVPLFFTQCYLFALCSSPRPRDEVSKAHLEYGKIMRAALGPVVPCEVRDRDASRRLKIAYLSGDLYGTVVGDCLEGLLRARDHEAVHVTCYQRNSTDDAQTETLRKLSDVWVSCSDETPQEVNERIRSDSIDILIDLGGHSGGSQLDIFALCPAPIQVNWIGYPNTTGLDCMHYRLVDVWTDPIESTQIFSERLVRLPTFFNCIQRPKMLSVTPRDVPPMLAKGFCTFGSFNALRKHSKRTKRTWGRLMMAMPDAQLMLKERAFKHQEERDRWTAGFLECALDKSIPGVNFKTGPKLKKRLRLEPATAAFEDHARLYDEMDIMLDSWPYCGTMTAADSLMMGVPVVTLQVPGEESCHAHNVTASILTQVGLSDLIATSEDEYIRIAVDLANNPSRLSELKNSLREKAMATICSPEPTPLCRAAEAEFRKMWLSYLEGA